MRKWIIKAIIQKTISFLPFKHKINFLFQRYITKGVLLTDGYFIDRLIHAKNHLDSHFELTGHRVPKKTLELGSGWYPIIPIAFYLVGADEIVSVDLIGFVNKDRIKDCINEFVTFQGDNRLSPYFNVDQKRFEDLVVILNSIETLSLDQVLNKLRIKLLIQDARKLDFDDNYFDLIHSNNTFEHIHLRVLIKLIEEFNRVLKRNGVMSHFIDMTDHYAHFDKSISIYNFLKFSDTSWRLIDNGIQPQNRLRVFDFEAIYQQQNINFSIINIRKGISEEMCQIKLNKRLLHHDKDSIAVTHCQFISLKS